jgi:Na+/proline symporter
VIDLAIVAAFILYSIAAGFAARRRASRSLDEYFLAGRTVRGWRAGMSMAATQFAADTPLLVAGLIAAGGIFELWRLWIYALAFLLMGFVLGPAWRRARVLTDAELTQLRYSARGALTLRALKAVYYGTLINCVVMAFVLVAATRLFELFLPWHEWLPSAIYDPLLAGVEWSEPDQHCAHAGVRRVVLHHGWAACRNYH